MSFLIGRGFAEVKILKNETGPYSWTVYNIMIKFCIYINIDTT